MPDLARWGDSSSYLARWSGRASIIGSYLSDCASVVDLGAGAQFLRSHIKGEYIPVDCVSLFPDTILVDLDSDFDPSVIPEAEGLAMAGLLEHVKDPLGLIAKLSAKGRVWAVSYMDSTKHSHNLVSLEKLEGAFRAAGMRVDQSTTWRHQGVYRLVRA